MLKAGQFYNKNLIKRDLGYLFSIATAVTASVYILNTCIDISCPFLAFAHVSQVPMVVSTAFMPTNNRLL